MSRAEEIWPGSGRPLGLTQWLWRMPSERELAFISAAKASTEP